MAHRGDNLIPIAQIFLNGFALEGDSTITNFDMKMTNPFFGIPILCGLTIWPWLENASKHCFAA